MKRTVAHALYVSLALVLMAKSTPPRAQVAKHHHYLLIDIGTFGGPTSFVVPSSGVLINQGMFVGGADTANPDPFAPNMCYLDCNVSRGFLWDGKSATELPPLPSAPGLSSLPAGINSRGQIIGQAQNGAIDPSTGWPETRGVLWQGGQVSAIATLGGSQATANSINDFGQVVGATLTATSDPFANSPLASCMVLPAFGFCAGSTFGVTSVFFPGTTETHAFLWHHGLTYDLGTLGGPDSNAWVINDRGEVAGWSFTGFAPNASTGVPTVDPFFWDPMEGKMIDIGSLGGTFGSVVWLNNRGQVAGASNLAGDTTEHPFIWSQHKGMQDLGALGGTFGHSDWINDEGDVVGFATLANDETGHAFLWHDGVMKDLGTLDTDPASEANSINSKGQIVGGTFIINVADLRGFLWEDGGPMLDLNALVLPGSNLYVQSAGPINDRGEIGCIGRVPNGDTHPCILIPCDEDHPNLEGCDYDPVDPAIAAQVHPAPFATATRSAKIQLLSRSERVARLRTMLAWRQGNIPVLSLK